MSNDYGPSVFTGPFYQERGMLKNTDERDNSRRETTNGNYLFKVLERTVMYATTAGMGERDVHALAMRNHAKHIDHLGPKALAHHEDSLMPVPTNNITGRHEPRVLVYMNDRLACHQEITNGLVTRDPNEVELIALLQARGLTQEDRYLDEDEGDLV